METIWYILEAAACVVVYAFVANRTMKLGSVLRRAVCKRSDKLLADDRLPSAIRDEIANVVPHLAKPWMAWIIVLVTPAAFFSRTATPVDPALPEDLLKSWRRLQLLYIAAGVLNSPAATLILLVMLGVGSFFASINGAVDVILLRVVSLPNMTRGLWHPHIMRGA